MQASIIIRSKRGKDASLKAGTSMKTRFFREETLARERERERGRERFEMSAVELAECF